MIKKGIKNYFSSLKYFFTPLGTMFLGMMLGFSVLIPGIISATNTLINGVKALGETLNLDFGVLFNNIWSSIRDLDWNDPIGSVQTIFSSGWLNENITNALQTILGSDFDTFATKIMQLIGNFTDALIANFAAFISLWVLGFIVGFFIIKLQIRKNIAKRSIWKLILATFIDAILTTGYVAASAFLFTLQSWSVILSVILLILLSSMTSLLEAYLVFGLGKIKIKTIVNAKNAGLYAVSNLIIFVISIIFTLIACVINLIMGIFVGLALIEIALIVINMNAEAYVKAVVEGDEVLPDGGEKDEKTNKDKKDKAKKSEEKTPKQEAKAE